MCAISLGYTFSLNSLEPPTTLQQGSRNNMLLHIVRQRFFCCQRRHTPIRHCTTDSYRSHHNPTIYRLPPPMDGGVTQEKFRRSHKALKRTTRTASHYRGVRQSCPIPYTVIRNTCRHVSTTDNTNVSLQGSGIANSGSPMSAALATGFPLVLLYLPAHS